MPGRAALLEALAEEAAEVLEVAVAAGVKPEVSAVSAVSAERALARFSLAIWPVGDRYRMLLALAQRDLGTERVAEILRPARVEVTAAEGRAGEVVREVRLAGARADVGAGETVGVG